MGSRSGCGMAISFLGGPLLVLGRPRGRERRGTLFLRFPLLFFLLPNFLLLLDGCSASVAPHPLEVDERLNVAVAVRVVQNTGFFFNPSCFCYLPIISLFAVIKIRLKRCGRRRGRRSRDSRNMPFTCPCPCLLGGLGQKFPFPAYGRRARGSVERPGVPRQS